MDLINCLNNLLILNYKANLGTILMKILYLRLKIDEQKLNSN